MLAGVTMGCRQRTRACSRDSERTADRSGETVQGGKLRKQMLEIFSGQANWQTKGEKQPPGQTFKGLIKQMVKSPKVTGDQVQA